ncbi:MAG: hypothetical protein KFF73_18075 [Cyclobacteriaceae bacterium]|nr:hypothetical protein [Cyclobacteriaceae bacterium]
MPDQRHQLAAIMFTDMKNPIFYFSILIFLSIQHVNSQIIPEQRRITWKPGIPEGPHQVSASVENVVNYGADPTGKTDSHDAFALAIDKLPLTGGVVYVPEGTYLLNSTLSINKSHVVLRGAGITTARLLSNVSGVSINVESDTEGNWQKITGGHSLGSFQIEVENGSDFTKGSFIEIQQKNDSAIMYTKNTWIQRWAENSVGQLLEIAEVNSNKLTLKTSLHHTFSKDLNPVVRPVNMVKNVGIENLYIQKLIPANHTISFNHTAYCWIKHVESYMTMRSHVRISASIGHEITECFFHNSYNYGGGGHGYGVECAHHASDVLVENNVFDSLRHAMMVQTGANGNVFAYNYSTNPVQGEPGSVLNSGWVPPDISVHGHYPFMNLFEGNDVMEIGISDYWGPAGPGNTYLRNKVNGDGILCYDHSHEQNLLGNYTTALINTDKTCLRLLEHGNIINGEILWDDEIQEHTIPASCYLDTAPAFFKGYDWPPFGPDAEKGNKLPAQKRYE